MALGNTFLKMFDKAQSLGHVCECKDNWVVRECGAQATMTRLDVKAQGTFLGFGQGLLKGVQDITVRMSSALEDKDCDGIAFLIDADSHEHLVFAELKSGFDVQKITGAYHQIIMSFIKMHAWLSLCRQYDIKNVMVHFIAACKCPKDSLEDVMLRISQAQQLGRETFETKFLKPLMEEHCVRVQMSDFGDIKRLPFHEDICAKEITMYLQLTDNPSESHTSVTLGNNGLKI